MLAGCAPRSATLEALYSHSSQLRMAGRLPEARAETEKGLTQAPGGSAMWWNFYLHKIQLVQQTGGAKASLVLLDKQPPDTSEFLVARARRKLYLAWALSEQSMYAAADVASSEAVDMAGAARDMALLARSEFFRAKLLKSSNRMEQAEQIRSSAEEHAVASKDREVLIYGLAVSSTLFIEEGRFEDALHALEEQLALLRQGNSRHGMAAIFVNIGLCRTRLGQMEEALTALQTAEKLSREMEDKKFLGLALGGMGNIHLDRREFDLARESFQGALQIANDDNDQRSVSRWLSNLASVATETKDWAQAEEINERALRMKEAAGDENSMRYSHVNRARILEGQGQIEEAEKLYRQIIDDRAADPVPSLDASSHLAQLYAKTGQDAKAAKAFESALGLIDRVRDTLKEDDTKVRFLTSLIRVHDDYVDFLMARGRTERALEIAEASRAQVLQRKIGDAGAGRPVGAVEYRRLARETGAVLLSYWLGPKRSYVWVTTGGGIAAYQMPPGNKIGALVERYRGLIEGLEDPLSSDDGAGRELYENILAPVMDRIPPESHVIVAPDSALNALNFETIPVPSPKAHYFIEDAVISVAPSLNLLTRAGPGKSDGPVRLLLIGDPNPPDRGYAKLPFAAQEMDAVKGHFVPSEVLVFRKQEASPDAYRAHAAQSTGYIHFTAHASSDQENPMESAIILSGPLGANRLRARDVARNNYPVRLVTISACRGAGAKTYAGEGLVGFMWAFFRAGARNIIAGLWDVSDESTPQLMDGLYGGLTSGVPAADALRNAKRGLMGRGETYRLPYYWGPFQLYIREAPAAVGPAKLNGKIARNAEDRHGEMARQVFQAPDVRSIVGRSGSDPRRVRALPGPADYLRPPSAVHAADAHF